METDIFPPRFAMSSRNAALPRRGTRKVSMKVAGRQEKDNLISNGYRGNPADGKTNDGGRSGRGNVSLSPGRPFLHHLFTVQTLNGQTEPGSRKIIPPQVRYARDPPRFPPGRYRPRSAGFQLPPPRCTPRRLPGLICILPPSRFRDPGTWSRSSCSPSHRPCLTRASSRRHGKYRRISTTILPIPQWQRTILPESFFPPSRNPLPNSRASH